MHVPFLVVSAIVPSLLLIWFFHARDVFREPPIVLWKAFGWGVLIVFPVVALVVPFDPLLERIQGPLAYGFVAAFFQAAIPEEAFKLLVVWRFAARREEFDEPMDGVVYGVAASLGFATLENLLYVGESGFAVALMRAFTAVPSHAFLGAIMGYFAGRARFAESGQRVWLWRAFWIPVVLHGLYDTPLLAANRVSTLGVAAGPWLFGLISVAPLVVVVEWIVALRLSRGLRLAQIRSRPADAEPVLVSHNRRASFLLTLGGAAAATVGGLVALGFVAALIMGEVAPAEAGELIASGFLLGVTPLAGGVAVFAWGLTRLYERDR